MKKALYFVLLICVIAVSLPAEVKFTFTEFGKPNAMTMDESAIYISEGTTVFIYNKQNGKLIKKFGKAGTGPQEFHVFGDQMALTVFPRKDDLLINSISKLSYYSKKGEYIKEINTGKGLTSYSQFYPVGNNFSGLEIERKGENALQMDYVINLYDENLKKQIELTRITLKVEGGKVQILGEAPLIKNSKGFIYISNARDFAIHKYDQLGKKIKSIQHQVPTLPFDPQFEKEFHEYLKTNPMTKDLYERIKSMYSFPKVFPAMQDFLVQDKGILVITYKTEKEKTLSYLFDSNGKLKKTVQLTLAKLSPIQNSPYFFDSGKFYQLVENDDDETWELHVQDLGI